MAEEMLKNMSFGLLGPDFQDILPSYGFGRMLPQVGVLHISNTC